jgi:DNA-binding transcriptional ArsR family regulator
VARPKKSEQLVSPTALTCDERVVHVEAVRAARAVLPSGPMLGEFADLFGAIADPTRMRLVAALHGHELCVCDLAAAIGQSESAVSHHLRVLRTRGLVRFRRDGRRTYYALDDGHVAAIYAQALDHVGHDSEREHLETEADHEGAPQ